MFNYEQMKATGVVGVNNKLGNELAINSYIRLIFESYQE
jgi:hypothetical protein